MDLNKVGLAVGVVALILAIPLAVLANLLTPRVQAWYGTTSLNRVNKRLAQLRARLKVSEASWTFTPAEWELYCEGQRTLRTTLVGIMGVFYFLAFCFEFANDMRRFLGGPVVRVRFLPLQDRLAVTGFLLMSFMLTLFCAMALTSSTRQRAKHFSLHTDQGRQQLRAEIERLHEIRSQYQS